MPLRCSPEMLPRAPQSTPEEHPRAPQSTPEHPKSSFQSILGTFLCESCPLRIARCVLCGSCPLRVVRRCASHFFIYATCIVSQATIRPCVLQWPSLHDMELSLVGSFWLLLFCNPAIWVHTYDFWLCFAAVCIYFLLSALVFEVVVYGLLLTLPRAIISLSRTHLDVRLPLRMSLMAMLCCCQCWSGCLGFAMCSLDLAPEYLLCLSRRLCARGTLGPHRKSKRFPYSIGTKGGWELVYHFGN